MARTTIPSAKRPRQASGAAKPVRPGARAKRSAERRDAILAAALDEFAARGFAATRLDDVARRADVAKGTIYLHFADKEALFEELIRIELGPVVGALEQASHAELPLRQVTDQLIEVFVHGIFETRRKDVIRLGHHRRAALSQARRILLPRGDRARARHCPRDCCAARSSAASFRATRWCAFRNCSQRPASLRSSGAACSIASSRSTCVR